MSTIELIEHAPSATRVQARDVDGKNTYMAGVALGVALLKAGDQFKAAADDAVDLEAEVRGNTPQHNYVRPFLDTVMASPELVEGFSAVLSGYLGVQLPPDTRVFADLTYEKIMGASASTPCPIDQDRVNFSKLSRLLNDAAQDDNGVAWSGNALRLLQCAADIAAQAASKSWIGNPHADSTAYDVAALVIAAGRVPGDEITSKQRALLAQVRDILIDLTEGDERVLDDSPPANATQPAEQDPRLTEVIEALEHLGAMVDFAFEGRTEGDTGSTENNLLSLASDYLDSIADDVQSGYLLGDDDPGRGHPELIHRLGRFEHLIEAIGVVIGARYPDSHREQARLNYLQQLLTKADEFYNDCECGKSPAATQSAPLMATQTAPPWPR